MHIFEPIKKIPHLKAPYGETVPQWDMSKLVKRECIVCSCADYKPICYRPDQLLVAQCLNCKCMYIPQVPDSSQLEQFYNSYSNNKLYVQNQMKAVRRSFIKPVLQYLTKTSKNLLGQTIITKIKSCLPVSVSETCELLIRTGGVEDRNILELGPGRFGGILPEVLQWGGKGIAIEVDPVAVDAIERLGLEVHASISEISAEVEIIYAGMVLEHIMDPKKLLKDLAKIAAPGGRILIRVPNGGQSLVVGNNWIGFRLDLEHLNYFDITSLSAILLEAGFQTECIWLSSQPILPEYLPMADRNSFISYAKSRFHKIIKQCNDKLYERGDYMLTVLARRDEIDKQ